MITFRTSRLTNGLKLLLVPLHETQAVTALLLVKVGSRYETSKLNGLSHFIEHLMFKGTKKRPTTLEISRLLDGVGADYNAFTAKDHTGYYIKLNAEKVELALDVLSDMVFQSIFDPKEIERERGVIVEEINMYEDNPMMYAEDLFEQTVFGDTPLGWKIAGPRENIRGATRQQIMGLRDAYHVTSNMILVVSGRLPRDIHSLIRRYFRVPRVRKAGSQFIPYRSRQTQPRVHVHFKDTHQVQLALGVPAISLHDPKIYAAHLLSTILGGTMSSRLFINIRERKGLCYFIRSEVSPYEDAGAFMIQAGIEKTSVKKAITAILHELAVVASHGVTEGELQYAKEYMRGKLVLGLEDSEHIASWAGKQYLFKGKVLTPAQQLKKIQRVTLKQVHATARMFFQAKKLNCVVIGPYKDAKDFLPLLRFEK